MTDENRIGKILTFYSFKGGVGRTMTVANVAFLAALNRQRVLVMDWDLEAPGLAYYFRGLIDAAGTRSLKDAPGILNILWEWSSSVNTSQSEAELVKLKQRFKDGAPFQSCVRSLLDVEFLPEGSALDFIGAGSRIVSTPEPRPYEDALAGFSWSTFIEGEAGGVALDCMREWVKNNYDIIFLDSRTGYADVAGVCTMQIPDAVALCFILNRQNIDGVAKVAAAIRTKRAEEITLHAVPMRVARQDTPEESDARARAIAELTRIGGFSANAVQEDFRSLSVSAADNVPFFETLAPFTAPDPSLDYLTLNYLRLATQLLEMPLEVPTIDPDLIELVKRRLQPRHATAEYVANLKSAEPLRAVHELERLIESALETEMDGGSLDEDYVTALVDTALTIQDQAESMEDGIGLSNQALDLLRALANDSPEKWMISLVSAIEVQLERFGWMLDNDEELALLEELDGFLAGTPTIAARLKRVRYRRRVARVLLTDENIEAAMQTVGEIQLLVKSVGLDAPNLALDQLEAVQAAEADISLLRGDAQRTKRNLAQASKEYQAGLDGLMHLDISTTRNDLSRLRSDLHFRLSETPPPNAPASVAAEHAIQAIKYGAGLNLSVMRFTKLARSIIEVPDRPDLALSFCESALDTPDRRAKPVVANYYGRTPRGAEDFLSIVAALCKIIAPLDSDQSRSMLALLFENSELVIKNLLRRRKTVGSKQFGNIGALIAQITHILESAQLSIERSSEWEEALKVFAPTRSRAPLSTDRE